MSEEYFLMKLVKQHKNPVRSEIPWALLAKRLGTGRKGFQCRRKFCILKNKKYNKFNIKHMGILRSLNKTSTFLDITLTKTQLTTLQPSIEINEKTNYVTF